MKKVFALFVILLVFIINCETTQTANNNQVKNTNEEIVSNAMKHYDFAKEYLKNKQWDNAIKNFNTAIKDSNNYIDAYTGLGKAFEGKMYFDKAESLYNYMEKQFPNDATGYVLNGYLYTKLREYNKGKNAFEKAIAIDSTNAKAWFGKGKLLEKMISGKDGQKAAMECYDNACKLNPENLAISYEYGKTLLAMKKYKKAQEFLEKVVNDHPNKFAPIANLAEAYLESREYSKAKSAYLKSIELDSMDINVHLGLARTYQKLKQYSNAEKEYLKITRIKPSLTVPYLYLGQMFMNTKKYNKAINYLNKALAIKSKDANALLLIAQCYFLKVNPANVSTDNERQIAYKNLDKAESYFNRIIANNLRYVSEAQKGIRNVKQRRKELDPDRW